MVKALRAILALVFMLGLVISVGQVQTFLWIQRLVRERLGDVTGANPTVSSLVALAVFALMLLVPWRALLVAPLTRAPGALVTIAVVCVAAALAVKFMDARLRFDEHGVAVQSWVQTIDGPVIVDAPAGSVDRLTGLVRQPLTPEVARSIDLLRRRGNPSQREPNKYFSANDGKNIVWFVAGTCETRAHDGFDDRGRRLEPATSDRVEACERSEAKARQAQQRLERANEVRRLHEVRRGRQRRFQEVGRYVAVGRFATVDGIRLTLEECVVLRSETRLKFRVAKAAQDGDGVEATAARVEFSLVTEGGVHIPAGRVTRVQGSVNVSPDSVLTFPVRGEDGWVVVQFARDSDSGSFAIAINGAIAFGNPAGHIARFAAF